jgi:poly(beta-D-mannuronate) lyase
MTYVRFVFSCLLIALLPLLTAAAERTITVRSAGELRSALKSAEPGLRILLADGTYDLDGKVKISQKAGAQNPICIQSEHRGKAVITGDSRFVLTDAEYVVIEGLDFQSTNGPAVTLAGSRSCRITRNTFHLKETQRGSWIMIDGIKGDSVTLSGHNRVDHNLFEKKSEIGNFITIEGTKRARMQMSQYDRIDHNYFVDIGPRVENGLEAIRAGSSQFSLSSAFMVIEDNLFERCDGDPEYISIKSSDDTIRHNTFRACLGSLSLRHGNRNTVEGNFILGDGRTGEFTDSTGKKWALGTGGVRFYGTGMRILNNYFEGLTGRNWDATFAMTGGDADYGQGLPLTKHYCIHDAEIKNNLLVNNASNFEIGYDGEGFQGNWWHLPPTGLHIADNVITGSRDTLIQIYSRPVNSTWENNIVWPTGSAVASGASVAGVRVVDPKLVHTGGIWRLPAQKSGFFPLQTTDVGPIAE